MKPESIVCGRIGKLGLEGAGEGSAISGGDEGMLIGVLEQLPSSGEVTPHSTEGNTSLKACALDGCNAFFVVDDSRLSPLGFLWRVRD